MRKMPFILLTISAVCCVSSPALAGIGDDLLLYNNDPSSTIPGLFSASHNTQSGGGSTVFDGNSTSGGFAFRGNDATSTPFPQTPLVGDINGDGVTDVVAQVDSAPSTFIGLVGRTTSLAADGRGNLSELSLNDGFDVTPPSAGNNHTFFTSAHAGNPAFLGDTGKSTADDAIATSLATPTLYRWDGFYSTSGPSGGLANDQTAPGGGFNIGFFGDPTNGETPIMADVNGDGLIDKGIIADGTGTAPAGWMIFQTTDATTGLDSNGGTTPIIQGNVGFNAPVIDTLFGDLDGDGDDDVVRVDDRNGTGSYIWEIGLTTGTGINTGGSSFSTPFGASPAGTTIQEVLLADMNGDGLDDFVQYWEFPNPDLSGDIFGQFLVAFTGAGGVAGSFNESTTYTFPTGSGFAGNIPFAGSINPSGIASADFNGDGDVDGGDFLAWQRGFGTTTGLALHGDGDANGDGNVLDFDLTFWEDQFGNGASPLSALSGASAVPEPTSVLLLGVGAMLALGTRRRG